ncbi:dihydrolipoamide acetyltransferase family protein [Paenirhodobacter sp.]|uniref:dihydrolipoamide acetyltransferase family protein n=1 Tax=Paenirhodobacter sp. TaxID=1965326 RepID=UPI003B4244A8
MGLHSIRMPDIGEGIAETEIAEWLVPIGQMVREDEPLVAVMTDKATVEIPSPVAGKVVWQAGQPGDVLAVGAELVRLEVEGAGNRKPGEHADPDRDAPSPAEGIEGHAAPKDSPETARKPDTARAETGSGSSTHPPSPMQPAPLRPEGEKPLAPPSVRARAREAGVDLRMVRGSGPAGRITHDDLSAFIASGGLPPAAGPQPDETVEEIRVIGLRRRIAERMETANRIPHITIVEEIDATAVEDLRARMAPGGKLTLLPFIARAIVKAVRDQPMLNAHYEDGVIRRYGAVHLGIAAQTPGGLMVPVVRHAEALSLRETAAEIARVAQAAKDGTARREELTGSTISITSLGPLGAIATTPILNAPEVAIVGVNRLAVRPHWNGTAFEPRRMMNLSCSFDHRVIDGWDAAVFVARLKDLLETPALIFVEA